MGEPIARQNEITVFEGVRPPKLIKEGDYTYELSIWYKDNLSDFRSQLGIIKAKYYG